MIMMKILTNKTENKLNEANITPEYNKIKKYIEEFNKNHEKQVVFVGNNTEKDLKKSSNIRGVANKFKKHLEDVYYNRNVSGDHHLLSHVSIAGYRVATKDLNDKIRLAFITIKNFIVIISIENHTDTFISDENFILGFNKKLQEYKTSFTELTQKLK